MFNPYPSLAGGARPEGSATAKTASYATIPAATAKDGAVVSPNPRTSPNARTAPHPVADAAVPKDSTPVPQDSPGPRTGSPTAKTAAYATLSPEDTRGKSGAGPLLPFNFLRGASKPGEAGEPTAPEDPKNPARKKP